MRDLAIRLSTVRFRERVNLDARIILSVAIIILQARWLDVGDEVEPTSCPYESLYTAAGCLAKYGNQATCTSRYHIPGQMTSLGRSCYIKVKKK